MPSEAQMPQDCPADRYALWLHAMPVGSDADLLSNALQQFVNMLATVRGIADEFVGAHVDDEIEVF